MGEPERLRYLSAEELDEALPLEAAIDAMEAVFADAGEGAVAPERSVLSEELDEGRTSLLLTMPASWSGRGFGAKVTSFIADNPRRGRPAVQGLAVLVDPRTGAPVLATPAGPLTVRRTAAMVGLATGRLARADAHRVGIIGTGALAVDLLRAVGTVRSIEGVRAFNRTRQRAERLDGLLPWDVRVVDTPEEAAADADILITATSSTEPVLDGDAIESGTHVCAVGNFSPGGREIAGSAVGRCSVWVDTYEGALAEAGEILLAAAEGHLPPGREGIAGDLHRLVAASGSARRRPDETTLFKSVGTALADIGALWAAHQAARAYDLGTVLES